MIRRARPDEAPLLRALVERAYAPWVPVVGRRPGPMDDDYDARVAAGEAWVLEGEGAVLGLLVLRRRDYRIQKRHYGADLDEERG